MGENMTIRRQFRTWVEFSNVRKGIANFTNFMVRFVIGCISGVISMNEDCCWSKIAMQSLAG